MTCFPQFCFHYDTVHERVVCQSTQMRLALVAACKRKSKSFAISFFAWLEEYYFMLAGGKLTLATRQIKCCWIFGSDRKACQLCQTHTGRKPTIISTLFSPFEVNLGGGILSSPAKKALNAVYLYNWKCWANRSHSKLANNMRASAQDLENKTVW